MTGVLSTNLHLTTIALRQDDVTKPYTGSKQ